MERRPVAVRSNPWVQTLATTCDRMGLRPNHISYLSMVFAGLGCIGLCFYLNSNIAVAIASALLTVACIQLRLLCNLLDGIVAVEHNRQTKDGLFWNEFPDRLSDTIIIIAFGYSVKEPLWGCVGALLALMTAYIRTLGAECGAKSYFIGPLAKQRRMDVICLWVIAAEILQYTPWKSYTVETGQWVLWIFLAGVLITCLRRIKAILKELH